ncbi:copii-coated vesicle component hrf1 [Moniliophthora roreri MCA 2997]|uniref:Protein YIF1 n=1 Tax=Moniliophthora roreri (strain MCA 2997) TaxID=1381753 RepID=V2YAJ1_MONRO|nr:copii-coated vesicle component hrf1 [Moniliophthora roreri MCA 2997]
MASPPPLRHPVPTHPAYIPEPPSTPVSPDGYQRYSSSPAPPQHHHQQQHYQPQQQQHQYSQHHPSGHIPQNQYQQRPEQQQQSFIPQPDFAAWGINDATTQFGMQLGTSAVAAGQEYVQKNFGGIIPLRSIKHHFNVSNSYVMRKLKLVVFPWTHKTWSRRVHRTENGQTEWQTPREDVNSPDLYIPLMAFVTYILLSAFHSGLNARFHPRILGESASSALGVVIVDFLFVYVGCYLLNVQGSGQAVDILAYTGYKFVGVILTILSAYLNPTSSNTLYYFVFLYFFLANALFLLRSLRSLVLPDPANATATGGAVSPANKRRRISFLFLEALCQVGYMLFLVRV